MRRLRKRPAAHLLTPLRLCSFGIVVAVLGFLIGALPPLQLSYADSICAAGTSLNIVAHEDDDLFFINPKIKQDIDTGKCVETMFLTAGEGERDTAYWQSREAGMGAAYIDMIGETDVNIGQDVTVAGHTATKYTFSATDRVSLLFLHLPDGGDSHYNQGESLKKLWQGDIGSLSTVVANQPPYTKQQLINVLRSRMNILKPSTIRTLDYTQDFTASDHTDHIAAALFAQAAHQDYTLPHQLIGYKGYPIENHTDNVTGGDLTNKINAYYAYDPYDYNDAGNSKCPDINDPTCPTDIKNWLHRNYVGGTATKIAHQFETMDGDSGSLAGRTSDAGRTPATVQFGSDLWSFYYDDTVKDLRYAKATSSAPTNWTFGALDTQGDVGQTPAAVVHNNTLHVFYYDKTNTNLRHAWLTSGGSWQFNNLDGDPGSLAQRNGDVGLMPTVVVYGTSMQLFYFDQGEQNLRHAWSNSAGTTWQFENFDGDRGSIGGNDTNTGYDPAAIVFNGSLYLFYYDGTNGNLRMVKEDTGWQFSVLDGNSTTGGRRNTTLGLNPSAVVYGSTLQLVYYDQTYGDLRHSWYDGATWQFENLDGDPGAIGKRSGYVGATPYIVTDGTTLRVFAYDVDRKDLRHYWTSSTQGWQAETLDGRGDDDTAGRVDGDAGEDPVALPFAGSLHVFYYERGNTNFRHSTL